MVSLFASLPFSFRFPGFGVLALVVKNRPEPLHQLLKSQADERHRSITEQAIFLLERGLLSASRRDPIKLRDEAKDEASPYVEFVGCSVPYSRCAMNTVTAPLADGKNRAACRADEFWKAG